MSACRAPSDRPPSPDWIAQRQLIPLYEARGFKLQWVDTAGESLWLYARRVARHWRNDTTFWALAGGVRLVHLNARGDTLSVLHCQQGEAYPAQHLFIAQTLVHLRTADSLLLETDRLEWHQNRGLVYVPGWVRLRTPTEFIRGEGLEYFLQTRQYYLRQTTGLVQIQAP
ncbi:MAG: hypothetical protein NZ958_02405 [Bacteroidia bacterium]|nr:hypothetical protein [Bacteroidia bacterium]MDW8089195.1 hypothetical protein [Bacteroidia bacterium]